MNVKGFPDIVFIAMGRTQTSDLPDLHSRFSTEGPQQSEGSRLGLS